MGSAHSKPKKARKNQISYPRTQANSKPLHAYGHSNPKSQPSRGPQPPKHPYYHNQQPTLHHPAEPRYYGRMKSMQSPSNHHNSKPSLYHPDEPQYYGTMKPATMKPVQAAAPRKPIKRKPVPAPSRAQVQYYSGRSLPPVPGSKSRAAVKSMRAEFGHW
ncbi:MAG: hypothetical protein Q9186_002473 [Xanthomendoza sp. 1 TL-2023]